MENILKTALTLFILTSTIISCEKDERKSEIYSILPVSLDKPSESFKFLISYLEETKVLTKQMIEFRENASKPVNSLLELVKKHQPWLKDAIFRMENFVSYIQVNKPGNEEVNSFLDPIMNEFKDYIKNREKLDVKGHAVVKLESDINEKKTIFLQRTNAYTIAVDVFAPTVFPNDFLGKIEKIPEKFDLTLWDTAVDLMEKFEDCMDQVTHKNLFDEKGQVIPNENTAVCEKLGQDKDNYIKRHDHIFKSFVLATFQKIAILHNIFTEILTKFENMQVDFNKIKKENEKYEDELNRLMNEVLKNTKERSRVEL